MLNYFKSECYRILHSREIYFFTGVVTLLPVLMNFVTYFFYQTEPDFPYGTVRFSLNMALTGLSLFSIAGAALTGILYGSQRRQGTLKNSISNGISRNDIFLSNCMTSVFFSFVSMVIIMFFYMVSASVLLKGPWDVVVLQLIRGIIAVLPTAIGGIILIMILLHYLEKETVAYILWISIWYWGPNVLSLVGRKVSIIGKISSWLPLNIFNNGTQCTRNSCVCMWDAPQGFAKCMIAGGMSILFFLIIGMHLGKKMEIK